MRDGSGGTSGTPGNEESVTCRFIEGRVGSNPTHDGRLLKYRFWRALSWVVGTPRRPETDLARGLNWKMMLITWLVTVRG